MSSSSNPRPLLSSNNKGHQVSARHNQPLGMRLVMPTSHNKSYGTHLCVHGPDSCRCRIRFPSRFVYRTHCHA